VLGRGILLVAAIVLLALLVRELRSVIVQFLLAVLLASAATPIVDGLTRHERARRWRWRPARAWPPAWSFLAPSCCSR
jgi:predicted PurR-regulated permease PerM